MTTLREVTAAINEALEIVGQICDQERQGRPLPAKLVFYISAVYPLAFRGISTGRSSTQDSKLSGIGKGASWW